MASGKMDQDLVFELKVHKLGHKQSGFEKVGIFTFEQMSVVKMETLKMNEKLEFSDPDLYKFDDLRARCFSSVFEHQTPTTTPARDLPINQNHPPYPIKTFKFPGIGFIFVNYNRLGADGDEINLTILFKEMGLEFKVHSCDKIEEELQAVTKKDLSVYGMIAVAICTHGDRSDNLQAGGEKKYSLYKDVIAPFKKENCPGLEGKPKIFIIQSCRADVETINRKEIIIKYESLDRPCVSLEDDFLVAHSTVWDHLSFRSTLAGSWFVTMLRTVFMELREKKHLLEIITLANQMVIQTSLSKDHEQTCQIESTLTKQLFFNL